MNRKAIDERHVREHYDVWHSAVATRLSENGPLASWHQNALELSLDLTRGEVLEVGCGFGDFARTLARSHTRVTATDFSEIALAEARRRTGPSCPNVVLQHADVENLSFVSECFDIVFCCEVLEHVPDPKRALREMRRVLKTGGALVLTTESYCNAIILGWLHSWLMRRPFNSGEIAQPIEHCFMFWQVRRWLREAGFRIERTLSSHHCFLLLPRVHPHTFVVERFRSSMLRTFFRPFGRHMGFRAIKL